MASKPSLSFNLGLPASPNIENAEQAALVQPLYNAVRGLGYTLDVYTGNTPITQEEREEVNPTYAARVQNLCVLVLETAIAVQPGQLILWGAISGGKAGVASLAVEGGAVGNGVVKTTGDIGDKVEIILFGIVSGLSGLTPGQLVYASTTAGVITSTVGTIAAVGRAIDANTIWFWGES